MKTKIVALLLLLPVLGITSCTLPHTWGENPLDRPYDRLSAADLQTENVRVISGNPGWMPNPE